MQAMRKAGRDGSLASPASLPSLGAKRAETCFDMRAGYGAVRLAMGWMEEAANDNEGLWHIICAAPGQDEAVAQSLTAFGLTVWLPTWAKRVRIRGTRRYRTEQQLARAGYVLVRLKACARTLYAVMALKGVTGMVGSEGEPAALSDDVVAAWRAFLGDEDAVAHVDPAAFRAGDRVRVTAGPFAGHEARVGRVNAGRDSASIDVDLFGGMIPAELCLAQLEKLL